MQFVDRDLVHFASGSPFECTSKGCWIGCAWGGELCAYKGQFSYGVSYMSFTTNQALLNVLMSNEIAYNMGIQHGSSTNTNVDLDVPTCDMFLQ